MVKRISPDARKAALALAVYLMVATATGSGALGAESAGPRVLAVNLDPAAVVGRPAELRVTAKAGAAPLAGAVVRFGRKDSFGLSACLVSSSGARPPDSFAPGAKVRFAVPHVFRRRGARRVLVRLDAGGCALPGPSAFQPLIVTPTRPGEPHQPPTLLDPPLPGPGVPPIPGADDLPPTGAVPALTGPAVPLPRAARGQRCPGAGRRVGHSAQSLRAARTSLLCLLNIQRQRHGLRRLRANAQLERSATEHSRAMVLGRFFAHVGPAEPGLVTRVRRALYLAGAGGWTLGENIGYGRWPNGTPRSMARSWMRSSGHRTVILRPAYRSVGIGIVRGVPGRPSARGATYTADFGVRSK